MEVLPVVLRFQFERFAFRIVRMVARVLPRRLFLFLGTLFGRFAYHADRRHRTVAFANFAVAFPEATREETRKTIRECYEFFGRYLFDMLTCFPNFPASRMNEFEFEGLDQLETAYAGKKGVILFTGHLGAWEIMAMAHGLKGFPMGVIARKLDNPYLQSLLSKLRTSTGNFVIEKKEGFRPMLRALREGKGIAILIDQNVITEDRIFVDFFGQPASTTPALALLKLKTGAVLIPVFARPLAGNRYRFIYGSPVEVPLSQDRSEDVRRITQECTRVLEEHIRAFPSYWLWMHRRWKTRP